MKLSRLYTDNNNIFKPIKFNEGLNVIMSTLAEDVDPQNSLSNDTNSSHNAGKTTLFYIVDFCLLSGQNESVKSIKKKDEFKNIVFFLEIKIKNNSYVTIRRSFQEEKENVFLSFYSKTTDRVTSWTYENLGVEKAKDILNKKLELKCISAFNYRKCLQYSMRPQKKGYWEIFKIKSYKDKDWKPYVSHILGLNSDIVKRGYELKDEIAEGEKGVKFLKNKIGGGNYDEIKSDIDLRESEIKEFEKDMENFDFRKKDLDSIDSTIHEIGTRITYFNNAIYNLKHNLKNIENSLSINLNFNLESIQEVFEEAGVYFKGQIINDYKSCLDFNTKITKERKKSLGSTKKEIIKKIDEHTEELELLSKRKALLVASFRETNSFKSLKSMTSFLSKKNAEIEKLKEKLGKLSVVRGEEKKINRIEDDLRKVVQKLKDEVEGSTVVFKEIKFEFSRLCKKVLGNNCILYAKVNDSDNIDFEAKFQETSEDAGSSWKRTLCILFDLCLVSHYRDKPFFKFIFHDSPFDGMDTTTKNNVLEVYREYGVNHNIQCILTILKSQCSGLDKKNYFSEKEKILEINSENKLLKGSTF